MAVRTNHYVVSANEIPEFQITLLDRFWFCAFQLQQLHHVKSDTDPEAIWSYQAYSTTTCLSRWIPFIAECIHPRFFSNQAQKAKRPMSYSKPCDFGKTFPPQKSGGKKHYLSGYLVGHLCLFLLYNQHSTYTFQWVVIYMFTCLLSCHRYYCSRDWINVWFPNSQILRDLWEN